MQQLHCMEMPNVLQIPHLVLWAWDLVLPAVTVVFLLLVSMQDSLLTASSNRVVTMYTKYTYILILWLFNIVSCIAFAVNRCV